MPLNIIFGISEGLRIWQTLTTLGDNFSEVFPTLTNIP